MAPVRGDLLVIVPSRGRPDAIRVLARRIADTATALTALIVAVDLSDPAADAYPVAAADSPALPGLLQLETCADAAEALNRAAVRYAPGTHALAYLPDALLPVTPGWDTALLAALRGRGLAHGREISARAIERPRHIVMRADIITALGYMVRPALTDPADWPGVWERWAEVTGGMGVADDVVIERAPDLDPRGPEPVWSTSTTDSGTLHSELTRLAFIAAERGWSA